MALVFHNGESEYTDVLRNSNLGDSYVCVIGGDGTLLRALSNFGYGLVPTVLAFNNGTVGHLLPLKLQDLRNILKAIEKNELTTFKKSRLLVSSHGILVANELVVRSKMFRLNRFNIAINGYGFELYASELVVSTRTGSSGYNLSLNGPLAFTECIILNCVGANRTRFTPIVLPTDVRIRIDTENCYGSFDGNELIENDRSNNMFEIAQGDSYEIAVSESYQDFDRINEIFYNTRNKS
ncbi:uncharacterized protein VICG_00945 [Vittaforma corneae ATCC 50505]|uniref:NAD+ kinase n=1 Tax=Vittaforma corneae (strain ATCC 50505) TaxID=993615 RepID=L2GMQ1_VITCO|nr:uncharacterized protein VICG_00945 [Vittaforma corneae ATCC 50505]ELA42096.1 hypothetical protein VICG_00945 [Vittaforma corneae ATCC 50505]